MTLADLNFYKNIVAYIRFYETQLESLYDEASGVNAFMCSDMPKSPNVGSPVESGYCRVEKRINFCKEQLEMLAKKKQEIEEYINNISDPVVKPAFYGRFILAHSWARVAADCNSTVDAVKKMVYRYILFQ